MNIPDDLKCWRWRIEAMEPYLHSIHQDDFDRAALSGFAVDRAVDGRHPDGMILHPDEEWHSLLRIMVDRGLVRQAVTGDGKIIYSLT